MFTSFVSRLITNAAVEKSVIYDRRETGFFEGKSLKFAVGLNCMTRQFHHAPARPTIDGHSANPIKPRRIILPYLPRQLRPRLAVFFQPAQRDRPAP
jgi:hypothetical protein